MEFTKLIMILKSFVAFPEVAGTLMSATHLRLNAIVIVVAAANILVAVDDIVAFVVVVVAAVAPYVRDLLPRQPKSRPKDHPPSRTVRCTIRRAFPCRSTVSHPRLLA